MSNKHHHISLGASFLAVLVVITMLTFASYEQKFTSIVPITLKTGRAGLTMDAGNLVKLRGVEIGQVSSVHADGAGAELTLAIRPKYVKLVAADSTAQIVPPTAFGAKYVQLDPPAGKDWTPITAHAVIDTDHVTVEANDAFENLMTLLKAADPLDVNKALTALSQGLDAKGQEIGTLVDQVNSYLTSFNPSLKALNVDLPRAASVADSYNKLTPDLVKLLKNTTTTSDTLVARQASLDAFLLSLTTFSDKTGNFLASNQTPLANVLNLLDPTTQALARYSPELPCLIQGLAVFNTHAEIEVGGVKPGINTYTVLRPATDAEKPYTNPTNLPVLNEDRGPGCWGLPNVSTGVAAQPDPSFGLGANPYTGTGASTQSSLASTLFGVLPGVVTSK